MDRWLDEFSDPLQWVSIDPPAESHIKVKNEKNCQKCDMRPCTYICPAQVYRWDEAAKHLNVSYQRCIECGACVIACPQNIGLAWPGEGKGVYYQLPAELSGGAINV